MLSHKFAQYVVIASLLSFSGFANAQSISATRANETKLVFEPAADKTDGSYIMRHDGLEAYFTRAGATVAIPRNRKSRALMEVRLQGSAHRAELRAEKKLSSYTNYLIGPDMRNWRTHVDNYGSLRYESIYPGIDLVYYGNGSSLEHDFIVSPGAQAGKIAFRIEHADNITITHGGDLRIDLGGPLVVFKRPVAYQEIAGRREQVPAAFVRRNGTDTIGFALGAYDHSRELVIDPVLSFATYLDGTQNDAITATTTDAVGNVYLTGTTSSSDFPLAGAPAAFCNAQCTASTKSHAFVSKLDPTGHTLLYSTFIGGSNGEVGGAITIDSNRNIIVAGMSSSSDFPQAGSFVSQTPQINTSDFFLASVKPDGSGFNYAGLLGGEGPPLPGPGGPVLTLDSQGNAYLAGNTDSSTFPITQGTLANSLPGFPFESIFISKVGPDGTLIYSTVVPGTLPLDPTKPNVDQFVPWGIAVDAAGEAIIAGNAGPGLPTTVGVVGVNFPLPQNIEDVTAGFVLKLNASASAIVFASYVPGADNIHALAVDGSGDMFVTGGTNETNLSVSANAFQKTVPPGQGCSCSFGYIAELDSNAQSILNASYLTGTTPSPLNEGTFYTAIALDSNSNIVVSGNTASGDVPMKNPLVSQFTTNFFITPTNGYIAELSADFTTLLFGSFFSGKENSTFTALTIDSNNNAILAGTTFGSDLPTTPNSFQTTPPPSGNSLSSFPHTFTAKINLNATAPSVCFGSPVSFGPILVGTSGSQTLNVTNCGNAPLQINTITSSLATFTTSQNCGPVAPGGVCPVQVTFSPTAAVAQTGTLTFADNASITSQVIGVSGTGGVPQVFFPASFTTSELIVGTQQEFFLSLTNVGNANWIISNVTATGDFTVDNQCKPPVSPTSPFCQIGIIFAPTQPGLRTGTLTVADNVAGSPHAISLSGDALSTYPTPSIVAIGPLATDRQSLGLRIGGTNFLPGSQVMVNGTPRATVYESQFVVTASLLASDMTIGELPVTITNPAPGGGVSNTFLATIYGVLRGIPILHSVFEPHSGLIYASVSTSSKTFAGQVIAIDPSVPQVVSNFSVGNGPNQLAISDDGSLLYVGLDGDGTVAQLALPGGTVNFAVTLGTDPNFGKPLVADALRVLPGLPHSWVVTICATSFSPCGLGVEVFDDSTKRTTAVSESQFDADDLLFIGNDASTLYATTLSIAPSIFWKFSITSSGITKTSETQNFSSESPGGTELDTDGTLIYTSGGQVIDPATVTIKNHLQGIPVLARIRVDVPGSRIYFAGHDPNFGDLQIAALDLGSLQRTGVLTFPEFGPNAGAEIHRWGSNGLAVTDGIGVYALRSSLTGPVPPAQFSVSGLSPASVAAGNPDLALTIGGTGFVAGDTVTANGVALTASVASGNQITTTVPAALLTSTGNLQITVTTADNHVGNLVLIITPTPFSVSGLSPASVVAGSPDLALTIGGTGFVAGDTVTANGVALTASVVSGSQITTTVPAALLTSAGNLQITVTTPDNHVGNLVLTITPAFSVSGLSPASVVAGSPDLALAISGTGFIAADTVTANGVALTVNVVSGSQITTTVPAALLTLAGKLQITITTPDNHVGNLVLTITPVPFSLSGLSPASVVAGSPDLALTIAGTGFVAGDTVTANGVALTSNVVSGSQITTTVPAALLTLAGNLQITVTTPDNHVGNLVLTITPAPVPVASVSASALNFPAQLVNTASVPQTVTVANSGGSNLVFNSIGSSGDFSQSNNCSTVAPGSSCSISVTFKPTTGGSRSGALTINDNAASSPQVVNLSGIGGAIVINTNSSSVTVNAGQTATYTLNVSAQGGISGQLTFNCSSLPTNASCSFNPPSTALSGSGVAITVSIATAQQTASLVHSAATVFAVLLFPVGLIGLGRVRSAKRGRAAALFFGALLLLLLFVVAGCGGGGSGSGGGARTVVTPAGTYTVTFTASGGGTSQSLPLTLVVQ